MGNPLLELRNFGQSVWHDNIRRGLITSGEFQKMVAEDGVAGVTSNPTIFEKAIDGSTDYDTDIKELAALGKDVNAIYEALVVKDIQLAADILRATYDRTEGRDGFACLEVAPDLARDTQGSVNSARGLWNALGRPNVMIKIPGTPQGVPAIEQCLTEGININITLLFSVENYEQVAWAYINALEKRLQEGHSIDQMASVASFFVSRIDTLVDKQLDERIHATNDPVEIDRLQSLLGRAGIANAKIAYQKFKETFGGERFQPLAAKGASVQRCLWASTSSKNPHYRDVMYVEGLLGPDTVNTMPQVTLDAFREHGQLTPNLDKDLNEARSVIRQLAEVGVDFRSVTGELQDQGVDLFVESYRKLLQSLSAKRDAFFTESTRRYSASLGDYQRQVDETLLRLQREGFTRRLWAKDASLWKGDSAAQTRIKNRLGWLTVTESLAEHCDRLEAFAQEVRQAGFQRVVLLGMGGSSLAPEVYRRSFGAAPDYLDVIVLDTTDPATILAVERSPDLARTLFLVSSKSGATTETVSLYKYFREKTRSVQGDAYGRNFVAITDSGTPLESVASADGFRRCFLNSAEIGGRYSALSYFGLVPATLLGVDVARLLDRAEALVHGCASCVPAEDNPGVWLGVILGELAKAGRDKVTFIAAPQVAAFGAWAEQLLAESTGKEGKGLIPIADEPPGAPGVYGPDRLFVYIQTEPAESGLDNTVSELEQAGQPVIKLRLRDTYDLGQEFFRWEIATAVAGALFGINPFDEPDVQESKDNTSRLLKEFATKGRLPEPTAELEAPGLHIFGATGDSVEDALATFIHQARPGDYVAMMAYLRLSPEHHELLQAIRVRLRDSLKVATTLGYGPRFLHSTGQLHKGGPNSGLFLQITADDPEELPIPGEAYGFSTLKRAQALGDLQSLLAKGRRVIRVHLGVDVAAGLTRMLQAVELAVARG